MSLPHWIPSSGECTTWIAQCVDEGISPRNLISHVMPTLSLPETVDDASLWHLIADILSEPERRQKLSNYNTLADAVSLLQKSSKIIVLTGAGVSVSCGIPDFRSKNGIYARLHKDFPDLPDPQAMFDIDYFRSNPRPFFDFAKEIFPGQFKPSLSHLFIKMLQDQGKLLRNYTQNIDTLEQVAGISNIVQCHGSFATATCVNCQHIVDCDYIKPDVMQKKIPRCPVCPADVEFAVLKPDIVFFGESLPKEFHDQILADKTEADLLIVIGSSLKVRPVALIPNCLSNDIPQILINREPLTHMNFDIELLGNCDNVINELCLRLATPWNALCLPILHSLSEVTKLPPVSDYRDDSRSPSPVINCDKTKKARPIEDSVESIEILNKKFRRSDENGTNNIRKETKNDCEPLSSVFPASPVASTSADTFSNAGSLNSSTTGEKMEKFKTNFHKILSNDIEGLRKMYKPRLQKISSLLPENTFFFMMPNRYVFEGAEVFRDLDSGRASEDSDDDDDSDDSSSECSSSSSDNQNSKNSEQKDDRNNGSNSSDSDDDDNSKLSEFSTVKRTEDENIIKERVN